MKAKTFIAINLNQFHENQKGEAQTIAQMRFIKAESLEKAQEFVKEFYPDIAWSVMPKNIIDKNIVYRNAE